MARDLTLLSLRRVLAAAALVLVVLAGHLVLSELLAQHAARFADAQAAMPARMEVVYVREMVLAVPPPRAARASAQRRTVAPSLAPAASAASTPQLVEPPLAQAPAEPEPAEPVTPTVVADALPPDLAASAAEPFDWPVSTRMRYELTGNFRGEVHGDAQVEWIRAGPRYQVHLDVSVGLLASRRMSSEGEITPEGLSPRRYDQETKLAFDDPHRTWVRFDGDQIRLATGQLVARWPGVQDTVSQFVQLSFLFGSQPERLRVGNMVEMPLAMPRKVSLWQYDVVEEETLYTPFGEVQAFHLKPRREPRAGGDMTVDIWIAPQLRHLPVRFRIRPDPEAYFDLVLDRRPELAAPDTSARNPP